MKASTAAAVFAALASTLVGCGPTTRTAMRLEWKPFDGNEYRQSKDGLTVEERELKELPPQFFATGQRCDENGIPMFKTTLDGKRTSEPEVERFGILAPGQLVYQVAITNENEHVVRLSSAVIRLFDPAGNQNEPLTKDDLVAARLASRRCPSTQEAMAQLRTVKLLDRNVELLPKMTWTGWVVFQPPAVTVPGTWKLAFYDLPTQTDPAGNVTRRTRFELRTVVVKYIDTFQTDGFLKPERLVKSEKAED
jgi:hypothetical protein